MQSGSAITPTTEYPSIVVSARSKHVVTALTTSCRDHCIATYQGSHSFPDWIGVRMTGPELRAGGAPRRTGQGPRPSASTGRVPERPRVPGFQQVT
ncbi:hypothetical protein GCM10023074_27840 [Microbispora amethystogenes]|uniref:Uncharacterized protein n=1 Tax=Microbispora amethystogenes TaxID=1427754 RepID=A0ABQ4F9U2_9ACTN|nr:hypothetical protein Mam01_17310 [Microbispora amethystogenes]